MTDDKELASLVAQMRAAGATVVETRDAQGRYDAIQISGAKGIGPHPMSTIGAAERMRAFLHARRPAPAGGREDYAERHTPMLEAQNERLRGLLKEARSAIDAIHPHDDAVGALNRAGLARGLAAVIAKIDAELSP